MAVSALVLGAGRPRDGPVGLLHASGARASSGPPPPVPAARLRAGTRPSGPVEARAADFAEV